jgi:hypothetical protein
MRRCNYLFVGLLVGGLVISPALSGTTHAFGGKKAEHEGPAISLDQVPSAAKATLEREAKGGKIRQVTQDTEKGKMVYEAEIDKNGKARFVSVDANGKVVKRESAKTEAKDQARSSK